MATIIEIKEDKLQNLSEYAEKVLKYGGKMMQCLEELESMLSSGSKMYVVCPLIDGNEKSVNATYEMLKEYGPSPIHRMSFLKKLYGGK